jgi:putative ABC transport system substrate-binding protein
VDRRAFLFTLAGSLLTTPLAAEAQPTRKVWRIGVLSTADGPEWEAFRQGLRTLGYVEGRNLVIDYRWHAGKFDRLPALAAELVALHVALIVTSAPQPTRAAKEATSTIPIVFVSVGDPVRLGLVESLARPEATLPGSKLSCTGGSAGSSWSC